MTALAFVAAWFALSVPTALVTGHVLRARSQEYPRV